MGGPLHLDDGRDLDAPREVRGEVASEVGSLERSGHQDHLHVGRVGVQKLPDDKQTEIGVLVSLVNLLWGEVLTTTLHVASC